MDDVATHGKGTFDDGKRQWKLRTKELRASATITQLPEIFREDMPDDARKSRPFWLRYLAELRKVKAVQDADAELEEAKRKYKDTDPDPVWSKFERDTSGEIRRKKTLSFDEIRILNAAAQISDPDTSPEIKEYLIQQVAPKPVPKNEALKTEIEATVSRTKNRGGKGWFQVRQHLDMIVAITGDVAFKDITVQHYREYHKKVTGSGWSQRTQANAMRCINTFLKRLEVDHDLRFGFRQNREYQITAGEGRKVQYDLAQVNTALQHATGVARTALLLGLNCGFSWGGNHGVEARTRQGRLPDEGAEEGREGCRLLVSLGGNPEAHHLRADEVAT